jgi:DNA transformation protein
MAVSQNYVEYVLEQLGTLPDVSTRRMFGAVGLYSGEHFFAIIDNDTVYFKVDDANREDYESRGAKPFKPYADRPEVSMSYFEVPADTLEDAGELARWARQSVAAASRKPAKASKRKPRANLSMRAKPASRAKPAKSAARAKQAKRKK